MRMVIVSLALAAGIVTAAAGPACSEREGIPTDAFGFTTGSDVAEPGSFGASLAYAGGYGVRDGRRSLHGLQLQGSYGLLPCLEVGPYLLAGRTDATIAGLKADERSLGAGIEVKYKLLGRDVHGVGLTVVIDPAAARNDPAGGSLYSTAATGLRLFADAALIPGRLYAAANLSHDLGWSGPSPYAKSSTLTLGGALAWQLVDGLYVSGEVRHQRRHDTLGLGRPAGHATFAGPGLFWQASERLALSAAYNVQLAGRAKGQPGDLDVTGFPQHQLKLKAAYGF